MHMENWPKKLPLPRLKRSSTRKELGRGSRRQRRVSDFNQYIMEGVTDNECRVHTSLELDSAKERKRKKVKEICRAPHLT